MSSVREIYNQLFRFESKGKSSAYPIHKKLNLSEDMNLLDWIILNIPFKNSERVLDAGCGTGYTLIRLAKEKGVRGLGISLSEKEVAFANKMSSHENMLDQVSFKEDSFDEILTGNYDVVVAIESLKHSQDLPKALRNLTKLLPSGGRFILIDDFIEKDHRLLQTQKVLWNSLGFTSIENIENILNQSDSFDIRKKNLTLFVNTRSPYILNLLISLTKIVRCFVKKQRLPMLNIYLGGLILEYLYTVGAVSYQVIIANKS